MCGPKVSACRVYAGIKCLVEAPDFSNRSLAVQTLHEHNHVETPRDLLFNDGECQAGAVPHCQVCEPPQRLLCAAGMDGCKRSAMAGIHCVQ